MNIFALHENPSEAAAAQCDKHIVKMNLETVQILNGALHERDLEEYAFYGYTHENHPCILWAADTWANFMWLCRHSSALSREYRQRYGHDEEHTSCRKMIDNWFDGNRAALASNRRAIDSFTVGISPPITMTDFPLAMPDDVKQNNFVEAYRDYYRQYKQPQDWFDYSKAPDRKPDWL